MHVLLIILALGFLILDAGLGYKLYVKQRDNVIPHVTIETGSEVTLDLFLKEDLIGSGFITDVSQIDTTVPASYALKVKTFGITRNVVLSWTPRLLLPRRFPSPYSRMMFPKLQKP